MYHITTMNFKPRYYSHLQKKLLIDAMTFGTEGQGRVMGGGGGGRGEDEILHVAVFMDLPSYNEWVFFFYPFTGIHHFI